MDVDRTNSLNHRKEFTVNYPSFCFATHGTSRRGELKFSQELCTLLRYRLNTKQHWTTSAFGDR